MPLLKMGIIFQKAINFPVSTFEMCLCTIFNQKYVVNDLHLHFTPQIFPHIYFPILKIFQLKQDGRLKTTELQFTAEYQRDSGHKMAVKDNQAFYDNHSMLS